MLYCFPNYSLKHLNTFGLDAYAHRFYLFEYINDLIDFKGKLDQGILLGGGSNMIFVKNQLEIVYYLKLIGKDIIEESEEQLILRVAAGENWHELVLWCMNHNLGGLENLSLIPGSVGAAPIQNIGAYGVELKDSLVSLQAINKASRKLRIFTAEDCGFEYRNSVFKTNLKGQYIITSIDLKLSKKNHKKYLNYGAIKEELIKMSADSEPTILQISQAVINIRQRKLYDPNKIGNCGSFFKNPIISAQQFEILKSYHEDLKFYTNSDGSYKISAAWLIERLGWKAKSVGAAAVSSKHALVLINKSGATGKNVMELSDQIMKSVKEKYKISLEREVNMIL